jgi:hypothetical protein
LIPPNLLINPGAEQGVGIGWRQAGSSNVVADANGQLNSGYYPRTGQYCFAGGYGSGGSPSRLIQNVQLLGGIQGFTEDDLDSGLLNVYMSFYYQSWSHWAMRFDTVEVALTVLSASSAVLDTVRTGELACRASNPGWCYYQHSFPLQSNARSIDYTMTFIRNDVVGSNIDSYIDDNSLKVM